MQNQGTETNSYNELDNYFPQAFWRLLIIGPPLFMVEFVSLFTKACNYGHSQCADSNWIPFRRWKGMQEEIELGGHKHQIQSKEGGGERSG